MYSTILIFVSFGVYVRKGISPFTSVSCPIILSFSFRFYSNDHVWENFCLVFLVIGTVVTSTQFEKVTFLLT